MTAATSLRPWVYLVIALSLSAHAEDSNEALAKIAAEAPDSSVSIVLQLSAHTTITQLVELTQLYRIDEMKVGARRLTNGREGILAFLTFSSLGTSEQQHRQAQCALLKPIGTFSFSAETMKKMEEEFPGEAKPWWFTEAIVITNAAEAYRVVRNIKDPITRAVVYERIPTARLETIRTQAAELMSKPTCQ